MKADTAISPAHRSTFTCASGQRLAVREYTSTSSKVHFILTDHLGSTSIMAAADGTASSELRYSAYGEERYASGQTPTDYRYTGQLSHMETNGLYYYGARWYDPR